MKTRHGTLFRPARRESGPPTGHWRRRGNRYELRLYPLCGKCRAHNIDFPVSHEGIRGMLKLAATTGFEMPTRRRDSIRGWRHDLHVTQLIAVALRGDHLTRKGQGRK